MTITPTHSESSTTEHHDLAQPLMVISSDAHVGPRLREDLRPYCEKKYLEQFDEYIETHPAVPRPMEVELLRPDFMEGRRWNCQTEGHWDPHAHLRDMDRDGVAGEVIFHASQNYQAFPFDAANWFGNGAPTAEQRELVAAGRRIYNRWLADFCSVEPERHAGMAQLPMWDIPAAIKELEWAAEAGLRGVNFPAADGPGMPPLDDPVYEDFFAASAATDMTLTTHIGTAALQPFMNRLSGKTAVAAGLTDSVPWGRRVMWILAYVGAFERHPNLKFVITEYSGVFWKATLSDIDSIYYSPIANVDTDIIPRPPSEYLKKQVWVGQSFQSREEAIDGIESGAVDRLCWGSDYPHAEGTYCYPTRPDETPMTRLALANTYHDLPLDAVRKMVGENALAAYPLLDGAALQKVADRIGPLPQEVLTAPDLSDPPHNFGVTLAFRTRGAWS